MNNESFHLIILTPYGKYFEGDATFLEVHSEDYNLGILPNHSPLISTLTISKMVLRTLEGEKKFAIGGGVINIEKDKTTLLLDSIEQDSEIDTNRAYQAKLRAEERLKKSTTDESIDVNRAKASLARALNRLNISGYNH